MIRELTIKHPITSVIASLGFGFVLGSLLSTATLFRVASVLTVLDRGNER